MAAIQRGEARPHEHGVRLRRMTQGLAFLLAVGIEAAVAAAIGFWCAPRLELSRGNAGLRCLAAAVIGTGVTQPAVWLEHSSLVDFTGSRWGGLAIGVGLAILVEMLFYAAALRGHWILSSLSSAAANAAAVGTTLALGLAPMKAALG